MSFRFIDGVLGPSWQGLYKVLYSFGNGEYKLGYQDGRVVGKAWNAEHLWKYYQLKYVLFMMFLFVCFL